ncbi:Similar to S.cerevisiae protein ELO3 (Elongase) [Malassezia sympodialis ATCC 42132]|uniref:Elongation of fatty acids protein n=1 Tax=Malassezia sympodialis (strain ATCC 42132) TaxID=1230383 RepID=A0A1M8A957_MALS4|nr:Similar to S.cerevisiae protein ELO3 (Elongase) [Malassezia sympodialis ATCC 42132]
MIDSYLLALVPASVREATRPIQSWQPGVTPFSTPTEVVLAAAGYLLVVLGGQQVMRHFPAVPAHWLRLPFLLHNLLLSLGSLILLVLYLERTIPFLMSHGVHPTLCSFKVYYLVEMYHIINYYFKYWEFIDTFFLVIKKKKLMFLHVYHHMATAALCYSQIKYETPVSWVVITMNLAVHVIMYGYYAMATLGIRCPWKKWITTGQILQFIIDLVFCFYAWYNHAVSKLSLNLPSVGPCDGSPLAAGLGVAVLTSYLFLFILFYRGTYKGTKASTRKTQ